MKKSLILLSLLISLSARAMTKGEADQKFLSCTKESVISFFVNLMELDQGLKPGSSGYKIFCQKAQFEDIELKFDDSTFAPSVYYGMNIDQNMTGRLKNFSIKPLKYSINSSFKTKDESGYVRTDFFLSYKPQTNPQNRVQYFANYIPSVVFDFENLIWDSFGRIDSNSTIKNLKVIQHPVFGKDEITLRVVGTGEESGFKFSSKVFMECMKGDQ